MIDQEKRLAELYEYDILDTAEEKAFNDLADLACYICDTPISLVTFIDRHRQWFKAKKNIDERETPLDISFCASAVQQDEVFVVEDASTDDRFKDFSNVKDGMQIRFYAGSPVRSWQGTNIGTLCVVDTQPRNLTTFQQDALKKLAHQASQLLELRRANKRLMRESTRLNQGVESYREFFENSPVPQWIVDTRNYRFLAANKAARKLYGYSEEEFLRLHVSDIVVADPAELEAINKVLFANNIANLISNHRKKDGTQTVVDVTLSTIYLQARRVVIATTIDLSEKLDLQQNLADEKGRREKDIAKATLFAQSQEREHLSKELHDNVNQMLASTKLYLDIASSDEEARMDLIERCKDHIHKTINEVRSLSHRLVAVTPKGLNVIEAIDELLEPYLLGKAFKIHYDEEGDLNSLPLDMKIGLLRILQEALHNTSKYAQAKNLWIRIAAGNELSIYIKDDGIGFDAAVEKPGIGLKNIQERVRKLQGTFDIIAEPGKGCLIQASVPIEHASMQ